MAFPGYWIVLVMIVVIQLPHCLLTMIFCIGLHQIQIATGKIAILFYVVLCKCMNQAGEIDFWVLYLVTLDNRIVVISADLS